MATISLSKLDLKGIVWNHAPVAPPDQARDAGEIESKRSDLPCPQIMRDSVEYRSTVDGTMITSRSQHREHLRRHGMIELGNERIDVKKIRAERVKKHKASLKDDIQKAIHLYKEGYRNPKTGPTAEDIGIKAPVAGTVRSTAPAEKPQIII